MTIDLTLTPVFIPLSITVVSGLLVFFAAWTDRNSSGFFADLFTAITLIGAIIANVAAWGSFILYKILS